MTRFVSEVLGPHARGNFSSGNARIDRYFRETVSQDVKRSYTACYVLVERDTDKIAGFYALSAHSVPLTEVGAELARKLARYPSVAAVLIGWLGRDLAFRGAGIGTLLLYDAISRVAKCPSERTRLVQAQSTRPLLPSTASTSSVPGAEQPSAEPVSSHEDGPRSARRLTASRAVRPRGIADAKPGSRQSPARRVPARAAGSAASGALCAPGRWARSARRGGARPRPSRGETQLGERAPGVQRAGLHVGGRRDETLLRQEQQESPGGHFAAALGQQEAGARELVILERTQGQVFSL